MQQTSFSMRTKEAVGSVQKVGLANNLASGQQAPSCHHHCIFPCPGGMLWIVWACKRVHVSKQGDVSLEPALQCINLFPTNFLQDHSGSPNCLRKAWVFSEELQLWQLHYCCRHPNNPNVTTAGYLQLLSTAKWFTWFYNTLFTSVH